MFQPICICNSCIEFSGGRPVPCAASSSIMVLKPLNPTIMNQPVRAWKMAGWSANSNKDGVMTVNYTDNVFEGPQDVVDICTAIKEKRSPSCPRIMESYGGDTRSQGPTSQSRRPLSHWKKSFTLNWLDDNTTSPTPWLSDSDSWGTIDIVFESAKTANSAPHIDVGRIFSEMFRQIILLETF